MRGALDDELAARHHVGMLDHKGLPVLEFATQPLWDTWLERHAGDVAGIWLKLAKQSSRETSVRKAEAVETALAHGWIDGQLDKFDEQHWLVRFTPRGPKSKWSQINRDCASRLIADGRMTARGLAEVEKAKQDGRWAAAYAPQSSAVAPADLESALANHPSAAEFFKTLSGANRYAILYRIHDAKTPKARAARIEKFVAMLAAGQTLHPPGRSQAKSTRGKVKALPPEK